MPNTLDARAKSVIDLVIDLEGPDRIDLLERGCAGDPELRRRVESLLASMEKDDAFLRQPTVSVVSITRDHTASERPGGRIGPYTLVELIGEGGFGSVYLAEQSEPVRRQVALKIIKLGMNTRHVIARFEVERHALALMDHPGIARVLDAAATDGGRPYFVMELVRGEPITTFCDRQRLSIPERLKLFRDVCAAVQHAHQKGVIHRDIKPSNVLVTEVDGRAIPKVIDFGIAKATAGRLAEVTLHTEIHQLIGTPEYMSPEQAESSNADIDTRSDIYSLGVLLFELLTGFSPFDRQRLRSASYAEMQRILREEEPPRPSLRLATAGPSFEHFGFRTPPGAGIAPGSSVIQIAQFRRTEPMPLTRAIRGDLDWIVLKCLEKDRSRRYETASALAEDIRRHLSDEPVLATPPSAGYRLRKFVGRNRGVVLAVAVIAATLVVATGISIAFAMRTSMALAAEEKQGKIAQNEAERANREADQARAVNDFLREVLTSVDPQNRGADVRLIDILASASATASQRFAEHPLKEAQVRDLLGNVYENLSRWLEAKVEYQKALALWREHAGADDHRALASEYRFATALGNSGLTHEAEQVLAALVPRMERVLGADDALTLAARVSLAVALHRRGHADVAERMLLELRSHPNLADDDSLQIPIIRGLIWVNNRRTEMVSRTQRPAVWGQSEPLAREWLERSIRRYGPDSMSTLQAQVMLSETLVGQGQHKAAVQICRAFLEKTTERLGECHHLRAKAMDELALALARLGEAEEPAELQLRAVQCKREAFATDSPAMLSGINDALKYLDRGGRAAEGEALARELTAGLRRVGGGHGNMAFDSELYVARFISMQGRLEEAEPIFQSLISREEQAEGLGRARLHLFYGSQLARRGEFEQAEQHLMTAAERIDDIRQGTWISHPDDVILGFIELYEASGQPDKAQEYRRLREEVIARATGPGAD